MLSPLPVSALAACTASQPRSANCGATFVTVGELSRWTIRREFGERRRARVEQWIAGASLSADQLVARCGDRSPGTRGSAATRPHDDGWITARALAYEPPLATLNVKHFEDYAEHEGLRIIAA
jgi:predicted nucleic acid-binding protein